MVALKVYHDNYMPKKSKDSKAFKETSKGVFYTCIMCDTLSLSDRISARVLVPRMFLSVVCERSLVEREASSTFVTDNMGLLIR